MNAKKLMFSQSVIAASLMVAYGGAWAEGDPTVAELIEPSSEVSVGLGSWSGDRQNMGRFDGMRKKDEYLLLDADIKRRDNTTGTWLNLNVSNLGTSNREIRGEYLQQGNQGLTFEYTEFRADAPYTINSNNQGIGTSSQNLGTAIPSSAIGSGNNYQLGTDRKKTGLSLYKKLMADLDLNLKFSSERKTGNELMSAGKNAPNGNRYDFVADLIDRTTNKAEITLNYNVGKLQLDGGYYGSWFKNNTVGYVAFNATAGAALGSVSVMTQPLDNYSHQFFVDGSYRFTPTTKGTFKLSYTRDAKDRTAPTSGIIGAGGIVYANLPSLNGKVDTTLLQIGLTAKPLPKLSLVANLRYNNRDDKTPLTDLLPRTDTGVLTVIGDTFSPRSYKTTTAKLEGTYSLPQGYAATAGIDYKYQDRGPLYTATTLYNGAYRQPLVPDREKLREPTYRLQLRKNMDETLNGSVAYLQSYRRGSEYQADTRAGTDTVAPSETGDRDRRKLRLTMDWTPTEKLGLQFVGEDSNDKYGTETRNQGPRNGKANLYSLDASYSVNDDWKLTAWYSVNTNNASFASYNSATNAYLKEQNDTGEALGFNLTGKLNAKTKVGAAFTLANDKTRFVQSNSNGTSTGTSAVAPDVSTTTFKLNLFAMHALDKNADLRFDLGYQKRQSNDWQWIYGDGLAYQYGNTTAVDGTSVITYSNQSATFVGARYIYKFQ